MPTLTNDVKGVVVVFSQKKGIWSNQFFYLILAGLLLIGYWWYQDDNTLKQGDRTADEDGTSVLIPLESDGSAAKALITGETRLILKVYDQQGALVKEQELLLPKEAIGLDFQSAKVLLTSRYQGVTIGKVGAEEIVLHKTASPSQLSTAVKQMPSEEYYLIKAEQGVIRIYHCRGGQETFLRETDIAFPYLSQADQELFTYGIVKHSEEELNELLQDFES